MEGDEAIVPENTIMIVLAMISIAVIAVVVAALLFKLRSG